MRTFLIAWLAATLAGTALAQPRSGTSGEDSEEQPSSESTAPADDAAQADSNAPQADPNAPSPAPGDQAQTENADEEPAPAPEPLPWRNSYFTYTNGVTANTFAPGGQLSYDPTWVMYFNLNPRWYFTPTTFLWVSQTMQLELTDTNDGTYNREPIFYDTLIDLRQTVSWEGFVFQGAARIALPLSKASQAAGRILQTALSVQATRIFPEIGNLTLSASFGYRRWWATTNVPGASVPFGGNCGPVQPGEPPTCGSLATQSTDRDIIITGLTASIVPIGALSINFSGFYIATYGHELAPANVTINGGGVVIDDTSPTHWRPYIYLSLSVGYDVLPWLNVQLGLQNSGNFGPLFASDGSVRSPFNNDTQIYLAGQVALDGLYGEFVGNDEDATLTPQERQRRRQGLAGSPSSRNAM